MHATTATGRARGKKRTIMHVHWKKLELNCCCAPSPPTALTLNALRISHSVCSAKSWRSGWSWKYHKITETIRYKIARERIIAVERITFVCVCWNARVLKRFHMIVCILREIIAILFTFFASHFQYKFLINSLAHRITAAGITHVIFGKGMYENVISPFFVNRRCWI